ncbi:hypothetical protein [Komarekiella delphini-convector]|uniref:hypothetical protein n=1 Tax=Komarekiella delphini-convector TaxID=3050158 RepID=UPI001783CBE4
MTSQNFQNYKKDKPNHCQATIQLLGTLSKIKLRLLADIHLRLRSQKGTTGFHKFS